jgi:hypothetical protein
MPRGAAPIRLSLTLAGCIVPELFPRSNEEAAHSEDGTERGPRGGVGGAAVKMQVLLPLPL